MKKILALVCFTAAAQPLELSMKRAVELALAPDGNTRIQLAAEYIRQAEARKAQSRAALLPNLDASVSEQNFTRNLRTFGINVPFVPEIVGPVNVVDSRATLGLTIFDFSAIRRLQAARENIDAAKAEREAARNSVADQTARAYLAALRAAAALEAAHANVELAEAVLKLANSQKAAGTGTGIEVTRSQVQLANERQRLLLAETGREQTRLQLLRVIGMKLDTAATLTDKLAFQATEMPPIDQAIKSARERRPDRLAQQHHQAVAELSYSAARAERLPTVQGFADYGGIGSEFSDARQTRTLGVTLRIPIFDGGRRDARRAESLSQVRSEKIRGKDLDQQIELDIRLALESLRSAEGQTKVAEEGLQLADNELAQAQRRYTAGVANGVEVTDAQTRLARARDNRIAALFNHSLARIDLATAMGAIHEIIQ